MDFHQILHIRRYAGCNHLRKFGFGKIKRFGIYGGGKFWVFPLKWLVTLTTVLRYRAACDSDWRRGRYWKLSLRLSGTVIKIWRLKDNGVTTVTFWSRDHSTRGGRLPVGGLL